MSPRSSKKSSRGKSSAAPDVYVALLFLSVAALITGVVFLWLELGRYDYGAPGGGAGSTPPAASSNNT